MNPSRIVITGAASGIGAAVLRLARERGMHHFGIDLTPADGVDLVGDVAEEATWDRLAAACPRPDVLVHAAAIAEALPLADSPLPHWRRVLSVNLDSGFLAARLMLRAASSPGPPGVLVLIASASGIKPAPGAAAYCTSKAALRTLARCAALEGAPLGLRVVALTPAGVRTELWERQDWFRQRIAEVGRDAAFAELAKDTPLARLAEPDEVARAALFLASDHASYITGSELVLDGGWTLR